MMMPKRAKDKDRLSPMKTVRAFCRECTSDQVSLIAACPDTGCPLWPLRMGKRPEGETRPTVRIIRRFCLHCVGGDRAEVRNCTARGICVLWPYRLGVRPETARRVLARRRRPKPLTLPLD